MSMMKALLTQLLLAGVLNAQGNPQALGVAPVAAVGKIITWPNICLSYY